MALKRRSFLSILLRTLVGAPLLAAAAYWAPRRVTEALRTLRYPGHTRALGRDAIEEPCDWAG